MSRNFGSMDLTFKVHIRGYMKSVHITETLTTVYIYVTTIYTIYILYIYSISCETLKNENCMWYLYIYIYIYNIHYTVHV